MKRESPSPHPPAPDRAALTARALKRHLSRLKRKLLAVRGDLAEAERAPVLRRHGEALLSYLHKVPARASLVTLPDPADPDRTIEIELDPALTPQANAARLFKRSAKAARGLQEIPGRIAAVESEIARVSDLITRIAEVAPTPGAEPAAPSATLDRLLDAALLALPPILQREVGPSGPAARATASSVARGEHRAPSSRLQPRRLRSSEGWDVLIGRSNEGNDYLTHKLARPEDYWFHVGGGVAGSHVVLRRGKGSNEPSKQTIEQVASWTAFYSQARTAGKVPVIYTRKKYVRKPRKGPPGLALCEREKSVMVRPAEPPRSALADEAPEGA